MNRFKFVGIIEFVQNILELHCSDFLRHNKIIYKFTFHKYILVIFYLIIHLLNMNSMLFNKSILEFLIDYRAFDVQLLIFFAPSKILVQQKRTIIPM